MKYLLLMCALFLVKPILAQDDLSKKEVRNIQNFIQLLKIGDKEKLSTMVQYPLLVKGGKVKVKSKKDFVEKFDLVFDKKLVQFIVKSKIDDWARVGSKGVMLSEGEVWFSEGVESLITVNGLEK